MSFSTDSRKFEIMHGDDIFQARFGLGVGDKRPGWYVISGEGRCAEKCERREQREFSALLIGSNITILKYFVFCRTTTCTRFKVTRCSLSLLGLLYRPRASPHLASVNSFSKLAKSWIGPVSPVFQPHPISTVCLQVLVLVLRLVWGSATSLCHIYKYTSLFGVV